MLWGLGERERKACVRVCLRVCVSECVCVGVCFNFLHLGCHWLTALVNQKEGDKAEELACRLVVIKI